MVVSRIGKYQDRWKEWEGASVFVQRADDSVGNFFLLRDVCAGISPPIAVGAGGLGTIPQDPAPSLVKSQATVEQSTVCNQETRRDLVEKTGVIETLTGSAIGVAAGAISTDCPHRQKTKKVGVVKNFISKSNYFRVP